MSYEYTGKMTLGAIFAKIKAALFKKVDKTEFELYKTDTEAEINAKISSAYKIKGSIEYASLPELTADKLGFTYNVTDPFTTDDRFVEGTGKTYPAGTNVVVVSKDDGYKFDVFSGMVDLSDYPKREEFKEITEEEVGEIWVSKFGGE